MHPGGSGALLGVYALDVFALDDGAFVAAQSFLGEFVYALIGRTAAGLDHVQNPALVRGQSSNLPCNRTTQRGALPKALFARKGNIESTE